MTGGHRLRGAVRWPIDPYLLFAGHAVGLVVLPLMIFHQAQLFVCATLARRYAKRPAAPAADRLETAPPSSP